MRYSIILAASIFLLFPALAFSATLKVPSQYPTIHDAINAASGGDTVLVDKGTYVVKDPIDFLGKAITVKSEQGPDVTVIDGNQYVGNIVRCVSNEGPDSVLDGFTVTNGRGSTGVNCGGMENYHSDPTVTNCIFSENTGWYSGGMYNFCSNPTVTNCIFSGNTAMIGGGMCNLNSSNPSVTNCTFSGNTADVGGGMYDENSSPTVTNCTFSENDGNGIYNYGSSMTVTNCTFIRNDSWWFGGGMLNDNSNPTVTNCTFSDNTADDGGGMCNFNTSSPMVTNCTFNGNDAIHGGGICNYRHSSPTVTNTILWNNDAIEGPAIWIGTTSYPSTLTISYSDVEGGQSSVYMEPGCTFNWGLGMIDADPLFVDSANGDFHLTYPSPCKDTGDNTAVTKSIDFEGDPRIAYGTVDMGADEFYTHLYWTGDATNGGLVEVKFVGLPNTAPVIHCFGAGILDPPLPTKWGDWYLQFPIIGPIDLGKIPSPDGVLIIPGTIPSSPPPPYSIPMQALIGAELSNLSVMEIK